MLKSVLAALFLTHMLAAVAMAQEPTPSSEYGRVSGGEIEAMTKQPRKLSGSLGIAQSKSNLGSALKGYEATLGGTLVQDRMWFFVSAHQQDGFRFGTLATPSATAATAALPVTGIQQRDINRAAFAKSTAQLGDHHALDASFGAGPSRFLSLRYDAAISSNTFFSASFSNSSATQRQTALGGVNP